MRKLLTKAREKIIAIKFRQLFIVLGIMLNLGLALHQYELFLRAYISPQKAIALYINVYGEANAELVMLTGAAILGIAATYCVLVSIRKGKYKP